VRPRLFSALFFAFFSTACFAQVAAPTINPVPVDGDTHVTVTTTGFAVGSTIAIFSTVAPAAVAGAVPVPASCTTRTTSLPPAANTAPTVIAGSQTAVSLQNPLSQGDMLCVSITPSGGTASMSTAFVTVAAPASPPGFDWGLVRAYFTVGALLSQADGQFSHQDLFMSFHLDKAYAPLHKKTNPDIYGHRPSFNTFFDTRLTSLPVAVQSCTPSAAGVTPIVTCDNSSSGSAAPATTTQAFLNSQKSARLEFGVYAPFMLYQWYVPTRTGSKTINTPYALFIAPLIKTGFDTSLNGLNQTQQSASTPNSVQPIGNSNEFYKFYDIGFRTGQWALQSDPSTAPDTVSYLDVTVGRFSNLASLICPAAQYTGNNTCNAAAGTLRWTRDMRLNVEGLLEVPGTHGFSVGFSANVAFDPFGRQGSPAFRHIRPDDDLRFLFAYKIDISKLAAKLAPQFSN
jgi:hypothetical protein